MGIIWVKNRYYLKGRGDPQTDSPYPQFAGHGGAGAARRVGRNPPMLSEAWTSAPAIADLTLLVL